MMPRTFYDDAYATCDRTCAVLRIYTGELDPIEVTRQLACEPTELIVRGTRFRSTRTGRERIAPLNAWLLSSEASVESKDLRRHLDWLLSRLSDADDGFRRLRLVPGISGGVNCIWWSAHGHGGPALWPSHTRRLAELELELTFEIMFLRDW